MSFQFNKKNTAKTQTKVSPTIDGSQSDESSNQNFFNKLDVARSTFATSLFNKVGLAKIPPSVQKDKDTLSKSPVTLDPNRPVVCIVLTNDAVNARVSLAALSHFNEIQGNSKRGIKGIISKAINQAFREFKLVQFTEKEKANIYEEFVSENADFVKARFSKTDESGLLLASIANETVSQFSPSEESKFKEALVKFIKYQYTAPQVADRLQQLWGGSIESVSTFYQKLSDGIANGTMSLADAEKQINDLQFVVGEVSPSVSKVELSATEKVIAKLEKIPVLGSISINPLIVAAGVSVGTWMGLRAFSSVTKLLGSVIGGAVTGGVVSALRKSKDFEEDLYLNRASKVLQKDFVLKTKGQFEGISKNQVEVDASDLHLQLQASNDKISQLLSGKALNATQVASDTIDILTNCRERLNASMTLKRELISWDDQGVVEASRTMLLLKIVEVQSELNKLIEHQKKTDANFEKTVKGLIDAAQNNISKQLQADIADETNELNNLKIQEVKKAFNHGLVLGGLVGGVYSIIGALTPHSQGSTQHINSPKPQGGVTHDHSPNTGIPPKEPIHNSEPHSDPLRNTDKTSEPGPKTNVKTSSTAEYLKHLRTKGVSVEKISRDSTSPFYNNPDGSSGNQQRLHFGGINRTGLNKNGDFELDISKMKTGGSVGRDGSIPDIENLRQHNRLKALITLDRNHQREVLTFDVDPKTGKIIIPHDHPAADAIYEKPDHPGGEIRLKARFIEIAEQRVDNNGTPLTTDDGRSVYRILATDVGKGHAGNWSYNIEQSSSMLEKSSSMLDTKQTNVSILNSTTETASGKLVNNHGNAFFHMIDPRITIPDFTNNIYHSNHEMALSEYDRLVVKRRLYWWMTDEEMLKTI